MIDNIAGIYAKSPLAMSIWTMGINQSTPGVCEINQLLSLVLGGIVIGSVVEGVGLQRHAIVMGATNNEGSVSHYIQCTVFGKSYVLRNGQIAENVGAALLLILLAPSAISLFLALMVCLTV
jgi:hypothetical protein